MPTVEDGTGTPGADVYLTTANATARMALWRPAVLTAFAALPSDARRDEIWIEATRAVEREVALCPDGIPLSPDPDVQLLLFPRTDATDQRGRDLVGPPTDDYVDGLLLYADELARAEAASTTPDDPGIEAGLKRTEVGPEQARFETEFFEGARSGDFFQNRPEIWRLLSTSFPPPRVC